MKIQKIIQGLAIMIVILLASCSEERIIDKIEEDGTFSISFASGDVETKAVSGAADGYSYTTPEELTINKCYVGVFNEDASGVAGTRIIANNYEAGAIKFSSTPGKFTIEGLQLPVNKRLRIVAIANPKADYTSIGDYATLKSKEHIYASTEIGVNPNYTFEPTSLIKVGELKNILLDPTKNNTNIGTVELRQLAAKIHLNLSVELPKLEGSVTTTDWNFNGVSLRDILDVLNKDLMSSSQSQAQGKLVLVKKVGVKLIAKYWTDTWPRDDEVLAEAFVCNEQRCPTRNSPTNLQEKYVHLTGLNEKPVTMSRITTTPTYLFNLKNLQILNLATGSTLIIPKEELSQVEALINTQVRSIDKGVKNIEMTFYSYEKPFNTDLSKALTILINGQIVLGNTIKTETFNLKSGSLHPIWNEKGNTGWGDGTNTQFRLLDEELEPDLDNPVSTDEKADPSSTSNTYVYHVVINPPAETSVRGGFINGYYYDVTGNLKPALDIEPKLNYSVNPWNIAEIVSIPDFE